MRKKVVLRADGNPKIGLGHVYRLLALAEMLRPFYDLSFVIAAPATEVMRAIQTKVDEVVSLPDWQYTVTDAKGVADEKPYDLADILKGDEIVVTDGYWFGSNYQQGVKKQGCKLVCVDDEANHFFYSDAVINHAPGFAKERYTAIESCDIYTGINYLMLRAPFFAPHTVNTANNDVFVSMGGSDYFRITPIVLSGIVHVDPTATIHVVVSTAYDDELIDEIATLSVDHKGIQMHKNIDAGQIVDILSNCRYAVTASSTVALEVIARSIKPLTGYYTANQTGIYSGLISQNLAVGIGDMRKDQHLFSVAIQSYFSHPQQRLNVPNTTGHILDIFKKLA